jgi:hypothetical protein
MLVAEEEVYIGTRQVVTAVLAEEARVVTAVPMMDFLVQMVLVAEVAEEVVLAHQAQQVLME